MRKTIFFLIIVILCLPAFVGAQASERAKRAEFNSTIWDNSAGFVGGSHARFPSKLPSYLLINPAIYNPLGVPLLELGYGGIVDIGADRYSGHRASVWTNIPIISGQLNGGIEFQTLDTSLASTGTMARLHFGWSNKIFEQFLLGFGIEGGVASGHNVTDWALSAKLGISQNLGTVGPFSEFTWYAAFTNIGKEMLTPGGTFYRSPFTPRGGVSAAVNFADEFQLYNAIHLAVPGFTDLLLNVQLSMVFFKRVSLSFAWGFDLAQQIDTKYQNASLLPRVSFSYSLLQEEHPDLDTSVSVYSPYENHFAFAAGVVFPLQRVDREGPVIGLSAPETIYVSPNNDGSSDNWSSTIEVDDESGVSRMELSIAKNSEEYFSQVWELEPVREEGIYGFIQEVFQTAQTAVIPDSLLISGKDNSGAFLPDGSYELAVRSFDILGNPSSLSNITLVVDTEPPLIEIDPLKAEEVIFSPNGDGNRDIFRIGQSGSYEDLWSMEIQNASGAVVWNRDLVESSPVELEWDGHDNSGERLPDGVYRYYIASEDRAGNRNSEEIANIIINSLVSPVKIVLADSHFSPNGDGIKDSIDFLPVPESRSGIKQWSIEILDDREEPLTTLTGTGVPPQRVPFDGRIQGADPGRLLNEGRYRAQFTLEYFSGNRPKALSPWFTLDLSPPEVSVELRSTLLSPNNDGRGDELNIDQQSSKESLWEASIVNSETSEVVKQFTFRGRVDESIIWDGRRESGRLAPDGRYLYVIASSDEAGNSAEFRSESFVLDTANAEVLVNASLDAFSPNEDGIRERQEFTLRVSNNDQVEKYTLNILSGEERVVNSIEGTGPVPEKLYWNGSNNSGRAAPDGEYFANLRVELTNRSVGEGKTRLFIVDTIFPAVQIESDYLIFSPNGDDKRDTLPIRQISTGETLYSAAIYNSSNEIVKEYFWENTLESFEWDGKDRFDNPVANGTYRYLLRIEDIAGNLSQAEIEDIVLDSRNTSVFVTLNEPGISPNNDGVKDELEIGLRTNVTDGIDRWSLKIYKASGEAIRDISTRSLNSQNTIVYDGRDDNGNIVEGSFYAQFNVFYAKGDSPEARSALFTVDTSGPELAVEVDPLPFSPDGDGRSDVLNFFLEGRDASGIDSWRLAIYDRNGTVFQEYKSTGPPENRIYWDGLSENGELVISAEDYPYTFEASDELGNTSTVGGDIPIDILVICSRDKSVCKIQIANISFEPNSPVLLLGGSGIASRNLEIITRLAEVFAKYSQYQITIEGHANNVSGTQREETEELLPLSTARAESVKTELVSLGMSPERISVSGKGATMTLFPYSDEANRWKNRRVEFILIR